MIINHNMNAMNAGRNMNMNIGRAGKSMEKLSSGLRINRAGDDAAGLAISEKMRGQIRGLDQASRNAQDGISLIQTAEGALNETHSILQRMRELSVQSANDTNNDNDRAELQKEIAQLTEEIDRISTDTEFNTKKLLTGNLGSKGSTSSTALNGDFAAIISNGADVGSYDLATVVNAGNVELTLSKGSESQTVILTAGAEQTIDFDELGIKLQTKSSFSLTTSTTSVDLDDVDIVAGSANFQIGANEDQNIGVAIGDMSSTGLGVNGLDVSTQGGADTAITTVQTAIDSVSSERSKLGAYQNRLEHTINNLNTSSENLQASESRIRDVDMAKEMMNFSKENILQQAAQAMLSQAKQAPQGVLQLLR